jgi:cytochrome c-type biogenesis protein CcmH/NrfG
MVYFKKEDYLRAAEVWEKVLKERPDDSELRALIQDARSRHQASGDKP